MYSLPRGPQSIRVQTLGCLQPSVPPHGESLFMAEVIRGSLRREAEPRRESREGEEGTERDIVRKTETPREKIQFEPLNPAVPEAALRIWNSLVSLLAGDLVAWPRAGS